MKTHPYVRAYMAGIVVPTLFLLVVVSGYALARFAWGVPVPIERVIVFPMAAVPNLWGVWNIFYAKLRGGRHLPIGLHGAALPLIIAPLGYLLARGLGVLAPAQGGLVYFNAFRVGYGLLALAVGVALVIYYLVWKYFVNFFNELMGIA